MALPIRNQPSDTIGARGPLAPLAFNVPPQPPGIPSIFGTAAATQKAPQQFSATALLVFTGTAADVQKAPQQFAATDLEVFTGAAAATESHDIASAAAKLVFTGTAADVQKAPQQFAASDVEVFTGAANCAQVRTSAAASGSIAGGGAPLVTGAGVPWGKGHYWQPVFYKQKVKGAGAASQASATCNAEGRILPQSIAGSGRPRARRARAAAVGDMRDLELEMMLALVSAA